MYLHRVTPDLLARPVEVLVVGCGGTGSAIVGGLPYLHQAMVARGHPGGLSVTLQDGDAVSEANCVRQPFCRGEIGHNKAFVLASRTNLFWGFRWKAIESHLGPVTAAGPLMAQVVISCVDTREARRIIDSHVRAPSSRVRYWLDLGNTDSVGQYLIGQPDNRLNAALGSSRLPTAPERWPELVDVKTKIAAQPSCSAAEAITRQRPFLNQALAQHALSLLDRLFAGGIGHHGAALRLEPAEHSNRLVTAIPVPAPAAEEKPATRKSRARARGRVRA